MPALLRNGHGAATGMEQVMARRKQRDHAPGFKARAVIASPKGDETLCR